MIYLDNAATTPVKREVFQAMEPYFIENYGNPSSIYGIAQNNKSAITNARETIAKALNAKFNEIYYTAGGSEADNWAIKGIASACCDKGKHIITSKIEHHAIINTCKYLEKQGYEVTYLDVDSNGFVNLSELENAIRPDTIIISIMFANNEIGTIQNIEQIGRIAREYGVVFHTDAVQAFGQVPIDVEAMNIDLLSASAHKINGPKGVGFLYIRDGIKIHSLISGGAQEHNRRAGTENVPGIVGMAKAAELAVKDMKVRSIKESELRDYLIKRITSEIPDVIVNGDRVKRLPNNANFCFKCIEGESLLIMLDLAGICCSSGSACASGSIDPSHVLAAIKIPEEYLHGSLRITLSQDTTKSEIDYVCDVIKKNVIKLREMSPACGSEVH